MEALEELVRQRDGTIAELERLNAEKDARISDLLSQLDKYKSVLLFAGTPGLPTGVFVAPSALPISRKQQRAWGISAEPPSSHSSRSGNTAECDGQPCQKFYKDQGSVYIYTSPVASSDLLAVLFELYITTVLLFLLRPLTTREERLHPERRLRKVAIFGLISRVISVSVQDRVSSASDF